MNRILTLAFLLLLAIPAISQNIQWNNQEFEAKNVKASLVQLNGEAVLKLERDLNALPFDVKRLEQTVDEPTYLKLKNISLENGIIEVKVLSRIQTPSPFEAARGFIGVAFRISEQDSAFECIYLRPTNGRSDNQLRRNRTVQYYSYPKYKFETLRRESPGMYETSAPISVDEWITMRIEIEGARASLFINDAKYSTLIVDKLKGQTTKGLIGLWVDVGTEGYFKDLKITPQ